jgi:general stress protein YciG
MPQNNANIENQGTQKEQKLGGQHDAAVQGQQPPSKKSNRGFASMDASKQREIASKGGRAAHQKGTAHQFTPDEAREAGRKGGGTVSQDRQHMAEIGRIGGQSRGANRATRQAHGGEPGQSEPAPAPGEDDKTNAVRSEESSDVEAPSQPHRGEYRH